MYSFVCLAPKRAKNIQILDSFILKNVLEQVLHKFSMNMKIFISFMGLFLVLFELMGISRV